MAKKPITLEELMEHVERTSITLADGKDYRMKNPGELTPNGRRKFRADMEAASSPSSEEELDKLSARIFRAMFYDRLPNVLTKETSADQVAAILEFFQTRTLPQDQIAFLRDLTDLQVKRISELEENIEALRLEIEELESQIGIEKVAEAAE